MPLFKKQPATKQEPAPGVAPPAVADNLLQALDDEIWRARRYERPLSVIVLTPRLLPAERLSPVEAAFAIKTVREVLRRSDNIDWVDGAYVVGILPETDSDRARAAAYRARTELERRAAGDRRITWRVASLPLRGEEFGRDLLDGLFTELAAEVN
jgi:hypothetical protein